MTRLVLALLLLSGLAACQSTNSSRQQVETAAEPRLDLAVATFRDACMASAPDFGTALARAATYGIGPDGLRPTGDLEVRVKPGTECLVITPKRVSPAATLQFYRLINQMTGSSEDKDEPFRATYNGQTYIFYHNRTSGDVFAMLKN